MKRIYQIEIDENGAIVDPEDIPALRALIGDQEPAELSDERALKEQFRQRFLEKRAQLEEKLAERGAFIKTKRDELNAAHRRAIEKVREEARERIESLQARIAELEATEEEEPLPL